MSKTVIKVENLGKQYRLGKIGTGSFSHDVNRWWHKLRGNEDPYLKIGEVNDRTSKGSSDYVWSLRNINFDIKQGDAVGIIGRNGAGKSTLLKILSRTTAPTIGKIKIRGRVASLLEVGTGFHPELTGRENIFLNGAILGMTKAEIKKKFDEIVDFSGVERYIDTPVKRYSSGMYVRLAFGVAAHLESEILIVDEVLAVGDAEFQKKCLGKMGDVSKGEGRTVLFVSHQMGAISQLCGSCIFLQNGELHFNGDTTSALSYYLSAGDIVTDGNRYFASEEKSINKQVYIKEAFTKNKITEKAVSNFSFEESVVVSLKVFIREYMPNVHIAIALLDKYQNRIFTVFRELDEFLNSQDKEGEIEIEVTLPGSIVAPNKYTFYFATYIPGGDALDAQEGKCLINIVDSGTAFAAYEGLEYGNVIVESEWR